MPDKLKRAHRCHALFEPIRFVGVEEFAEDLAAARFRCGGTLHTACIPHHLVADIVDIVHPVDLRHLHLYEPFAELCIIQLGGL